MATALVNNRFLPHAMPSGGGGDTSPWDRVGTIVQLDNVGDTVAIGAAAMVGGEKVRIVGNLRVEGQVLGDNLRAEDTAAGTGAFLELDDGSTAALSAAGEARIRYNTGTNQVEVSQNGAAYTPIFAPSGGGWTDTGTIVRLTTATDNVIIGAAAQAGTEKFRITGGAVLVDGTTGAVPVAGAGTRLMWAPAKAALRAGLVTGAEWDNVNVGSASVAFNTDTVASGANSFATGDGSDAEGAHSAAFGQQARGARIGQVAVSNGAFATVGDSQTSTLVARRQTTNNVATELTLDGAAPAGVALATSNRIILQDNTTYNFVIDVVARNIAASQQKAWQATGVIKRDVGAATVAFVGVPALTVLGQNPLAASWLIAVAADAVNGSLQVLATGQVGKTIKWTAGLRITEIGV